MKSFLIGLIPNFKRQVFNVMYENGKIKFCFEPLSFNYYLYDYSNVLRTKCIEFNIKTYTKNIYYYEHKNELLNVYDENNILLLSYEFKNDCFNSCFNYQTDMFYMYNYYDDAIELIDVDYNKIYEIIDYCDKITVENDNVMIEYIKGTSDKIFKINVLESDNFESIQIKYDSENYNFIKKIDNTRFKYIDEFGVYVNETYISLIDLLKDK